MYHFTYQTTNLINGHIYIGVHSTLLLNDEYLGSGKILKQAISKYGKEHFKRQILCFYDSFEKALQAEKEIVTEEFISRPDTYNLNIGGHGSWHHRRGIKMLDETKRKISAKLKGREFSKEHKSKLGHIKTIEERERISKALKGRSFSEAHKQKIKESHANVSGKNNPMFGKGPTKGSFNSENHPRAKKITIDGVTYSSGLQAVKALGRARVYKFVKLRRDDQQAGIQA